MVTRIPLPFSFWLRNKMPMKCAKEKQVVSFADNKFYSVLVEGLCVALLGKCNTIALFETLFGLRGFDTTIFQKHIPEIYILQNNAEFYFLLFSTYQIKAYIYCRVEKAEFMAKITLKLFCFQNVIENTHTHTHK